MPRLILGYVIALAAAAALVGCGSSPPEVVEVEKVVEVVKEVPPEVVEVERGRGGCEGGPLGEVVEKVKVVEVEVTPEPPERLRIGLMTIRTGAGASFGIPYDTGPQILASEVNESGGWEIGGKRYLLDLDIQDSKWEIPLILGITEKWVSSDRLKYVITGGDPMIGAADPITTPQKVIHISTTWDLEPVKNPYTFGTLATHAETAPIFFNAMREYEPDVESVVYMAVNFRFDINGAEWTQEVAEEMGYEWIGTQLHDIATPDFLPVATAAIATDPDMILIGAVQANSPLIIRAIRELGYEGPVGTPWGSPSTVLLIDAFEGEEHFLENFYAVEQMHYLDDPDLDALIEEYERRVAGTGVSPSGLTDYYHTLLVLLHGLQGAGTIDDPDAIARAIERISIPNKLYPGDPIMTMGGTEKLGHPHQLQVPMALNVVRNGKGETLDTFIATAK